jgi:phosphinothricin acetyltransferase
MNIILCDRLYADQILAIFNEAILNSTALYDYKPWTKEIMEVWFKTKAEHDFPVIGIINDENVLMGFGSYGSFRIRPAYKYTIENSLYVHKDFRDKGLGKLLLQEIIKHATAQNYHCIVGVIDAENERSIALHQKFGFESVGTFKQVGFKFDKWLDATFMQLTLNTPTNPKSDV